MDKQQPSTPKSDLTIGADSQCYHHPTNRVKRFYPWLRSIVILTIIPYILISCNYSRTIILGTIQPSSYTSFPLGQNKQVTLNKTFYLKHQYCVDMNIEFIDGMKKVFGEDYDKGNYIFNESADNIQRNFSGLDNNIKTQIYKFQVIAYNSNNIEIINKEYTNTDEVSNVWSGTTTNDKNKSYLVEFECFTLPRGEYKFVITDKSKYINEFEELITSIGINPNYDLK